MSLLAMPHTFGAGLKRLLASRKIKQRDLAEQAGLHANTISAWVNAERPPHQPSTLAAIAQALDLTSVEFVEATMDPAQPSYDTAIMLARRADEEHLTRGDGTTNAVPDVQKRVQAEPYSVSLEQPILLMPPSARAVCNPESALEAPCLANVEWSNDAGKKRSALGRIEPTSTGWRVHPLALDAASVDVPYSRVRHIARVVQVVIDLA